MVDLTTLSPAKSKLVERVDLTDTDSPVKLKLKPSYTTVRELAKCDEIYSDLPLDSDDDDNVSKGTQLQVDYYHNNRKWPVWSRSTKGIPSEELIKLVMTGALENPLKVCTHRPIGVRHNALFVLDLKKIKLEDVTADDNGSWSISTPRRFYEVERSEIGKVISVNRTRAEASSHRGVYTLVRQYGTHKATKDKTGVEFKRMVATVRDSKGNILRFAVLQYFFKGGKEEDIILAAHGNSKGCNKRPYMRTEPSTMSNIKATVSSKTPKKKSTARNLRKVVVFLHKLTFKQSNILH